MITYNGYYVDLKDVSQTALQNISIGKASAAAYPPNLQIRIKTG